MSPRVVAVTCQDCGIAGYEELGLDLMANICPACFDARIAPVFASTRTLPDLYAGLVKIGCHPERTRSFLVEQAERTRSFLGEQAEKLKQQEPEP